MAADGRSTRLYDVGVTLKPDEFTERTVSLTEPQADELHRWLDGKRRTGAIEGFSIYLAKPMGAASVRRWLTGLGIGR